MSIRIWFRHPGMRVALGALAVSVLVVGWTLFDALRVEAVPNATPAAIASLEAMARSTARARPDIATVVDGDVFAADRSAPSVPYRMPGDPDPNEKPSVQPEKPLLLGTVVATDSRSFATVQLGGASPMLVHVGDKIGEWVVRSIERGKIVLVSAGGSRADITVPKPGT